MKKRFRLLSLALGISLTVSIIGSTTVFALDDTGTYEDKNGNSFSYEKTGSTKAAIVGYTSDKKNSSVTIPERIGALIVTDIGDGHSSLFPDEVTSVTLPDHAKTIKHRAFANSSAKNIKLDSELIEIGEAAFKNCYELTQITIPDEVKKIGNDTFKGCSALSTVKFGKNTRSIGESAFEDCSKLTKIELPSSLHSIGEKAFDGCSKLDTITIPGSVNSIGKNAFDEDNLDLEIDGYTGTTAQTYASKNKIFFKSLGSYANKNISVSTNSVSVAAGSHTAFSVTRPTTGIVIKSSDDKIAKVSLSGTQVFVTGVSAGSAAITLTVGGYDSETVGVTVTPPAGGSYPLSLDTSSYSLNAGQIYYLKAKTNATVQPSATSSAPGVASVKWVAQKPDGYIYEIKGLSAGSAVVTFVSGGQSVFMTISVSAFGSGNIDCDTTVNFSKSKGQIYTFKMTVSDTFAKPSFTVGNGKVLKTYAQKQVGNDYYYQIIAIGKPGESTGVYTTFPGQNAVKHCTIFMSY